MARNHIYEAYYREAVDEFNAISAKLRALKSEYEVHRHQLLQLYNEAQREVELAKRELKEENDKLKVLEKELEDKNRNQP